MKEDDEYFKKALKFLQEGGDVEELKREVAMLSAKEASMNYKLFDVYTANRILAMRLMGYASENRFLGGSFITLEIEEIVDKYLGTGGRKNER